MARLVVEIEEFKGVSIEEARSLGLSDEDLLWMYRKLVELRKFEERVEQIYLYEARIQGTAHLYFGEEAVAVGVAKAIEGRGYITSTHRGHGHALAMGIPAREVMAELFGKFTGVVRGLGGSMHVAIDPERRALWSSAIVGSGIPIAVGAGLALKYKGEKSVIVSFFSDGATNTGAFHEALNLASFWKLPIIFACENNQWAISMPASRSVTCGRVAYRAAAYGMPGVIVDGNDVLSVFKATKEAADRAIRGEGPVLIEYLTYRLKGHGVYDKAPYRPKEEVEEWAHKDPIPRFEKLLLEAGVASEEDLKRIREEVEAEIEESVKFADESEYPDFNWLWEVIYA